MEVLGEQTHAILQRHPPTPVKVDPDIRLDGVKNPTCAVIIGFSTLGIFEALRANKNKHIDHYVIIEPDLGVVHQTIQRHWIGELAKAEDVDLVIGIPEDQIVSNLYKIFTKVDSKKRSKASTCHAPEVFVDPFSFPMNDPVKREMAEKLSMRVTEASRQVFLSMGCASDSFYRYEQLIRNKENIQNSYKIKELFGRFEMYPAIVLGAGPSLKDFIKVAKEMDLENKAVIIACDAALGLLLREGIRPHFVTRCERKLTNIFKGVNKEDTKGIYYAAYPWTSPEFFDLFEDKFMLFRDNGPCKWSGYDPGSVNGGVSSANAGLELAYLLGCKKIAISGIDLAFLDNKSHVEGTEVEFDINKSKAKWSEVASNNGGVVTTIPVWKRCLHEYESTLLKWANKGITYNTSLNGARIAGAQVKGWEELKPMFAANMFPLKKIEKHLVKHDESNKEKLNEIIKDTLVILKATYEEFGKLQANVRDVLITASREEERVVDTLKDAVTTADFFAHAESVKKSLTTVYTEPARQVDAFRVKHFSNIHFVFCVLDVCQVDLFLSDNKASGLRNLVPIEHERLRQYVLVYMGLMSILKFYTKMMIELLENGPRKDPLELEPGKPPEENTYEINS